MVFRVLPYNLECLVAGAGAGADQLRRVGLAVLGLGLAERSSKQPSEHPEAVSAIERVGQTALGETGSPASASRS